MNRSIRLAKKMVVYLTGLCILGTGIAGFYYAGWGSDPLSVLYDGVHVAAHVSYGTAAQIVSLIGVIFVLIFARRYFHVGTISRRSFLAPASIWQLPSISLFCWRQRTWETLRKSF